ncbi:MAG TPA: glycoside hydrolase family 3 N-terminal domain-containing protein, partial [Anaerolineae bacterium]|nr:glycoside hydrolase family 3 N-terminal domain-containing protein [Anaerolineae bacterium]
MPPTPTQRSLSLLAQMTLDEKLAQMNAVWMHEVQENKDFAPSKADRQLKHGIGQITRTAGDSTLEPAAVARFNNAMQSYLVNQTRLGIPAMVHE